MIILPIISILQESLSLGPHGDTGLTGRKIIVDTYGGKERTAVVHFLEKTQGSRPISSHAMRHIAKNMVAAGICSEILVQVSYAIGVSEPMEFL